MTDRAFPQTYEELRDAIDNAVFPDERHWLDYKRELYQNPSAGTPAKPKSKKDVHLELARDLASLAVRGGYLVFGVEEDRKNHTLTVVDMPLTDNLDQTVDQVARDQVTPPLSVTPTLMMNPAESGSGMLVIEVLESPDAPHSVGEIYYGRSETGKVKLSDDEIQRLMARRGRTEDRLARAMAATIAADPEPDSEAAHMSFTAMPTQGSPEMLLDWTKDSSTWRWFTSSILVELLGEAGQAGRDQGVREGQNPAFADLQGLRRGQNPRGAWFTNYLTDATPQTSDPVSPARRLLGLADDGTVRFINLAAGSLHDGKSPTGRSVHRTAAAVVYEHSVWWHTLDMLQLVARLSADHNYRGNWLLGITLSHMKGRQSSFSPATSDSEELPATYRATTASITDRRADTAAALLRPLFRDLESEQHLDQMLRVAQRELAASTPVRGVRGTVM